MHCPFGTFCNMLYTNLGRMRAICWLLLRYGLKFQELLSFLDGKPRNSLSFDSYPYLLDLLGSLSSDWPVASDCLLTPLSFFIVSLCKLIAPCYDRGFTVDFCGKEAKESQNRKGRWSSKVLSVMVPLVFRSKFPWYDHGSFCLLLSAFIPEDRPR